MDKQQEKSNTQAAEATREPLEFYSTLPTSPATEAFLRGLTLAPYIRGDTNSTGRAPQSNRRNSYQLIKGKKGVEQQIIVTGSSGEVELRITDVDTLLGSNKGAKKLFNLALIEVNRQAIREGQLTQNYIVFPVATLVRLRIYATPRSAREGFYNSAEQLTDIKISGRLKYGKGKTARIDGEGGNIFYYYRIAKGLCYLYLNTEIDWNFLIQYFTVLPRYYFSLSNRGADLLRELLYLARQNIGALKRQGRFIVKFPTIQRLLCLPALKTAERPRRDIIEAVDKALEDIEEQQRAAGSADISLLLKHPYSGSHVEDCSIADYIEKAYLEVTIKGELLGRLKETAGVRSKRRKTIPAEAAQAETGQGAQG